METNFYGVGCIVLPILEALLQIWNSEDGLKRSIYPAGSALVTQAEGLHC
jgi:hypothetical protein